MATLKDVISCTNDCDPDALPVARANQVIRNSVATLAFDTPVKMYYLVAAPIVVRPRIQQIPRTLS